MQESELVAELFEEFASEYEAYRVRTEYKLGADSRPDIVVMGSNEEPLLIIEVKTYSDKDSQRRSFDQLRRYQSQSTASYLGFFTKDIRYVYQEREINDYTLQVSSETFPDSSTSLESQRGLRSSVELQFCYEQAKRLCKKELAINLPIEEFLQSVQRKIIAEQHDLEICAWKEGFGERLRDINETLQQQFPFYETISDEKLEQSRIIQGVLNGYSLEKTEDTILEEFVSQIPSYFEDQSSYGTPIASAEYITDRLDVSSEDRVLDPAMGWGNVLRELAKSKPEAEYKGIEINPEIARTASALNTITGSNVPIRVSDGIKLPWDDDQLRSAFDHVVLDPPTGKRLSGKELPDGLEGWGGENIEDVFLYASLQYLDEGGLLTAIIPLGLLSKNSSERIRRELIEGYQIESVIEVDKGSFYPSARSDLAVIQVRKQSNDEVNPTQFIILDQLNGSTSENIEPEVQNRIELHVSNRPRETLIPSKVVAQQGVEDRLYDHYPEFRSFDNISATVRRGTRLAADQLGPEGSLQYLKISHVTGESDSQQFVDKDQVENQVTAGPTDLLISAAGSVDVAYVPEEEVVPHSNWVVIRFDSESLARVYQGFFCTEIGTDYLESLATGTTIPHLSVSALNDIQVPDFESFLSLEDAVAELAQIEQLHRGRVDQSTAVRIQEILQGDR